MQNVNRRDFLKYLAAIGATASACSRTVSREIGQPFSFNEMLARVTTDSALINLYADNPDVSILEIRANGKVVDTIDSPSKHVNVRLSGLNPSEENRYQLRFKSSGKWLETEERSFRTQRTNNDTFTVDFIADSHLFDYDVLEQNLRGVNNAIDLVKRDKPDFVVFLGDEIWAPYKWEIRGLQDMPIPKAADFFWNEWRKFYSELLPHQMSIMSKGNHDGENGYGGMRKNVRYIIPQRKQYFPQPNHLTYPEGGENNGFAIGRPNNQTVFSPLENYFAFTWGDTLFVILDVQLYTNIDGAIPSLPSQWTLGQAQLDWLKRTLENSDATRKLVIGHHLVGGWDKDQRGSEVKGNAYGRGGARYYNVGEQKIIHELMVKHGGTAFVYGHDHIFSHQIQDGIHYICGGKPSSMDPRWWYTDAWNYAYPDFIGASGYMRWTFHTDGKITLDYVRCDSDEEKESHHHARIGEPLASITLEPNRPKA